MSIKVNVRLPDVLHATIIDTAKSQGVTLTAVVVGNLSAALGVQTAPASPAAMVPARRTRAADVVAAVGGRVTVASKLPPVTDRPEPAPQTPACPECGGLRGVHGKWCGKK